MESNDNNTLIVDEIRNNLITEKNVIGFSGDFDNPSIPTILNLSEKANLSDNKLLNSKYHHSLIELVQNAKEYTPITNGIKSGFFLIENLSDFINVSCCNAAEKKTDVDSKILSLNQKKEEELNSEYKKAYLDDDNDGGLGIIQFAKYLRPSPIKSKTFYIDENQKFVYIEGDFIKN